MQGLFLSLTTVIFDSPMAQTVYLGTGSELSGSNLGKIHDAPGLGIVCHVLKFLVQTEDAV